MERVIFHVDVNSAFLSWEAVHRLQHLGGTLDLREIPSAIGGDAAMRHGIILAKSIPAKACGVKTGEPIWEAKKKCPELVLAPPNYGLYEKASGALMELLGNFSPEVEQYSVDEAFVDMTGTERLWGEPEAAAKKMKKQIREELGFTVNIGISSNKLLAKMAGDLKKPDRIHTLFPGEIKEKLWPLPVSKLFFVGRATAKKLFALGIETIGELAETEPQVLKCHLKSHGEVIRAFANGMDTSAVEPVPLPNKGYGNSTTVPFDVTDQGTGEMILLALAETVCWRLRRDKVKAEVVSVSLRDREFRDVSHQMALGSATNITGEIHEAACRLFRAAWDGKPLRKLGLHTGRIRGQDVFRQAVLFDSTDYEKLELLDGTVDEIRSIYGMDAMKRAVFLDNPIDHMSGGISREKRSVDYDRLVIE